MTVDTGQDSDGNSLVGLDPYAHWFKTMERDYLPPGLGLNSSNLSGVLPANSDIAKGVADAFFEGGKAVPLPKSFIGKAKPPTYDQVKDDLPFVPANTVITGIIDTGIALNHMRTRFPVASKGRGKKVEYQTRFISAWQQGATVKTKAEGSQPWLPCGREVFEAEINEGLKNYGDIETGHVDETAFNRALKLTEPNVPLGNAELEHATSHGTHVLDLAVGQDPDCDPDLLRRQRLIAVNLPSQFTQGSAANFLAYFATYAVSRIITLADYLWQKNVSDTANFKRNGYGACGDTVGYPIVINFSYGMQAGPKDGNHLFETAIREILHERCSRIESEENKTGKKASPVRILMPAGNGNLYRSRASAALGKKGKIEPKTGRKAAEKISLPWRIIPADATSNFLEIWTSPKPLAEFEKILKNLKVTVTPPGRKTFRVPKLKCERDFHDIVDAGKKPYARVYVDLLRIPAEEVAFEKGVSRYLEVCRNKEGAFLDTQTMHALRLLLREARSDSPARQILVDHGLSEDDIQKILDATKAAAAAQEDEKQALYRLDLLVCTARTAIDYPGQPMAPAGLWKIDLEYNDAPVDFDFYVQSDISATRGSMTGKRPYFDHEGYREFLVESEAYHKKIDGKRRPGAENGALADSFHYDYSTSEWADNDDWERYGPVQRRGGFNALASLALQEMIAIGSYDDSNGFPALYSASTAEGSRGEESYARQLLTAAYPGENAHSLFGLLGAGARDGSTVGYRGTSMSTALATRDAVWAFLTECDEWKGPSGQIATEQAFRNAADRYDREVMKDGGPTVSNRKQWWVGRGNALQWQTGSGRMRDPRNPKVDRLGRD